MIIAFEGVDGVGKSTLIKSICNKLDLHNIQYVTCGSFPKSLIGEDLQWLIESNDYDWQTEAHIFALARRQIFTDVILPNYFDSVILLDRFIDSSYVYQGLYNAGLRGYEIVRQINEPTLNDMYNIDIKVDLTVYLTGDIDIILDRLIERGADYELKYDLRKIHELYDIYYTYFTVNEIVKTFDVTKTEHNKIVDEILKEIRKL